MELVAVIPDIFGKHAQVTRRRTAIGACLVTVILISHFVLLKTVGKCKGVDLHLLQILYLYCLPRILNGVQYCYNFFFIFEFSCIISL